MKTSREIIQEVGEWATANFGDKHDTLLGMVEEIGELSHCLLKRIQGIRGFDREEHFKAQFEDALADFGIYLAHYCYNNKRSFQFLSEDDMEYMKEHPILRGGVNNNLSIILISLANAVGGAQLRVENLVTFATALGYREGVSFEEAVRKTWAKVQQRDWKKNPTDADKKC